MLPIYRERGGPDDEDCIYIHSSGGRPVNFRRTVLANCGDDALDLLAGDLTVEDCIIRNAFDKGVSALENNAVIRRTLIIDNDIGISGKSRDTIPRTITLDNVTRGQRGASAEYRGWRRALGRHSHAQQARDRAIRTPSSTSI